MRKGFTLIEMVLATAIAALLMVGVLGVLTSIARDRQRVATTRPTSGQDTAQIIDLFRRDLACAKTIGMNGSNTLVLDTFSSLDGQSLQPIDRPARVTYRLAGEDSTRWLIREQAFADDSTAPPPLRSLVACRVQRLEVASLGEAPNMAGKVPGAVPTDRNSQDQQTQIRRVRLRIDFEDSARNIDQVLCLR
jgi:prepilin-type N-terminal cleavage/methylation domain-containing protein